MREGLAEEDMPSWEVARLSGLRKIPQQPLQQYMGPCLSISLYSLCCYCRRRRRRRRDDMYVHSAVQPVVFVSWPRWCKRRARARPL
jgi:hypothetical protein